VSGEDMYKIKSLTGKEGLQLIDCNDWYGYYFSILLIIPGNWHSIESLIELFELFNNELVGEDKALIIGP
jgi:hypothetical protein